MLEVNQLFLIGKQARIITLKMLYKQRCIEDLEETTDFKIKKLAIVNIPKEDGKDVSFFKIDKKLIKNERYLKAFRAVKYLAILKVNLKMI